MILLAVKYREICSDVLSSFLNILRIISSPSANKPIMLGIIPNNGSTCYKNIINYGTSIVKYSPTLCIPPRPAFERSLPSTDEKNVRKIRILFSFIVSHFFIHSKIRF